jgi:hypothetical protein
MLAIRATYDGREIHIPEDAKGIPACNVIVLFERDEPNVVDLDWVKAQEQTLAKAWDDEEDAVYDSI